MPEYYKERSAAAAALSPKMSLVQSETSSKSADSETKPDKDTKAMEESASTKSGTSTSQKKEASSSSFVPDAVAHLAAIDVSM